MRILVIEDNTLNRTLLRYLLEPLGYEVLEAEDGAAGIACARALKPDLILMDLNLPKLNGLEVLERIRASDEYATIPVIMLTVSERQEDIQRSYRLRANTYITKPVDFAKFVRATEILGEYWIVIAKLPPKAA